MIIKPTYQELEKQIKKLEAELEEKAFNEKRMLINQQRLNALWKISSMVKEGFKEICDILLVEIAAMTESQYGFFGFINDDESEMKIYSWSESVMNDCSISFKPLIFSIEKSGIWGNAVRERKPVVYNDYSMELANKKGVPEGHVTIKRLISVPVFSTTGKIVALGCVANKKEDYDDEDESQLIAYLNNIQLILESRKREEERKHLLEKSLSELKILRGMLPLCSFCKKIRDDKGYWEQVDVYIHKYSEADISHSICPQCLEKHYPEEYNEIFKK
jgi:hypothetical protein